jgi:hypothetical protein
LAFWVYFDCLAKDCVEVDVEMSSLYETSETRGADVADRAVFVVQQARVSCPYPP